MKAVFNYINLTLVSITIILAIRYGEKALTAYFFLGIFQLISAFIILLIKYSKKEFFKEIMIYWILIILYFFIMRNIISNEIIELLIIPILIAIYHCYMTFKITKK